MTFPNRASVVTRDGGRPRNYYQPPDKVIGYPIDGWWGIVEPPAIDYVNLVENPSVEIAITGYAARNGAAISRVTGTQTRRGAYGLYCIPTSNTTDGVIYTIPTSLVINTGYVFGVDFKGTKGLPYKVAFGTSGSVLLDAGYSFRATGYWQRLTIYRNEILTASRRVMVYKDNAANLTPFVTDGWLVSASDTADPLMYWDGDSVGYVPNRADFYWNGPPHASTSTMRAFTRAGGRVKSLSQLGFTLLATLGLGLAAPNNVTLPLALPGGEQYQDTLAVARTFDLLGFIQGASLQQLQKTHSTISRLLDTRHRPYHQPMTLLYEALDECGESMSELLNIQCSFAGGMESSRDNHYRENLDLRFRIHVPYVAIADGTEGASLNLVTTIANANNIIYRNATGGYSALGTGANDDVRTVVFSGRTLYAGGPFTSMSGVANTLSIARYNLDTATWSAMGTGSSNVVFDMVVDTLGRLVAVSAPGLFGGVANTNGIGVWNGTAWIALGTGSDDALNPVLCIAIAPNGFIYVGGSMSGMGGVANTEDIAMWNGAAWVSITPSGISAASSIDDMAFGPDGFLYVVGTFTTINGVAAAQMARYNPTTGVWTAIAASGSDGVIATIAFSPSGLMYLAGQFTTIAGFSAKNIAVYNGFSFHSMAAGVMGGGNVVTRLLFNQFNNLLYIGGDFDTVNGVVTTTDGLAIWNGSAYLTADIDLPSSPNVYGIAVNLETGEMAFGFDSTGTATAGSVTTIVTNSGTADTFPIMKMSINAGIFYVTQVLQISNFTTGESLFFNELYILSEDILTIDLSPGVKSISATHRGDMTSKVAPGSNMSTFHLAPGANTLAIYQVVLSGTNPSGLIYWTPTYAEIDDAVR